MKFARRFRWCLGAIMAAFLAACTSPTPAQVTPTHSAVSPSPTFEQTIGTLPAEEPVLPTPATPPIEERLSSTTQYIFDVVLDYDRKALDVYQTITYTNTLQHTIEELPILIPPAYQRGVFSLNAASIDQTAVGSNIRIRNAQLNFKLEQPLESGQQVEIQLGYQLQLPKGPRSLGYTNRQLLLNDWYPFIPPYQMDVGWIINSPGRVGEHLVYPLSDFDLNLCLLSSNKDLVIAASTPLADQQDNCLVYIQQDARNISLAISPYYQVFTIENDDVTINSYMFPEHAGLGMRSAALALQAWETFTDLFGDNQRGFLSIVETDIFDGYEADGLILLSDWYYQTADPSPQNYFELLVVHETAHQWFYAYVHNDQANEPWLDEALSTYCELLYYELHHPDLVNWWWRFRVNRYAPEGNVDATIYTYRQFRPYVDAVYLRGALFLQELRDEMGDDAFFEGLWHYVQSSDPESITTAEDFFNAMMAVSKADLIPIITEFFQ